MGKIRREERRRKERERGRGGEREREQVDLQSGIGESGCDVEGDEHVVLRMAVSFLFEFLIFWFLNCHLNF